MSAKTNLIGKSREQIAQLTRHKRHEEMVDLLYLYTTLEPHYSPRDIAVARGVQLRRVVAMCRAGTLRAHKPSEKCWRVPLSAVLEWDRQTAVTLIESDIS